MMMMMMFLCAKRMEEINEKRERKGLNLTIELEY
jgi:hypothetical protein